MLRSLPGYVGGYNIQSNIGEVQNKGWEFALNATPLRAADFEWTTTLNVALLKKQGSKSRYRAGYHSVK